MKLLYISCYQFKKMDGKNYALPAYGNSFWTKYLDVFESVHVLGETIKEYLDNGTMAEITQPSVSMEIIPSTTHPRDFKNDSVVKEILEERIKKADAILIKPSSRKGMMAIKIAEKYKKPYMIELTGDLRLTLKENPNLLKKLYGPVIHRRILKSIRHCKYGLYVTEKYLQKVYPIEGKQCGATDASVDTILDKVLEDRLHKIETMDVHKKVSIGLIGSYHDERKGIDTAIEALAKISPEVLSAELNILALGTEEDREKWRKYAEKVGLKHSLNFPPSCDSTQKVLEWIDTQDINILPSRSEGLPRCIVEAMSRGCPCITSNICGLQELINDKWLHAPSDFVKLSELIIKILSNKEEMKSTALENFDNSKRFLKPVLTKSRNEFLMDFKKYCESVARENKNG